MKKQDHYNQRHGYRNEQGWNHSERWNHSKIRSLEFITNLSEEARKNSNIIGQFGVGFYSVFMVADEVRIKTKSYQKDAQAFDWHSDGSGNTLTEIDKEKRGTDIIIHLKEEEKEYTDKFKIQSIIKNI